jgi:hypothetical protein
LLAWIRVIEDVGAQFGEDCPAWPTPLFEHTGWKDFVGLTQAFYAKWDSHGLPFDGLGHPTALGVTYRQFVADFKALHGNRVCIACDGPLDTGEVDHWINQASFPLLSIAPQNLLPMCHGCNRPGRKGKRAVFQAGETRAFAEWFHPFFYPAHGRLALQYPKSDTELRVRVTAIHGEDVARAARLERLLSLDERWTSEFIASYGVLQRQLRQLVERGRIKATADDLRSEINHELDKLRPEQTYFELKRGLYVCALEPERLDALVKACKE